MMRRLGGLAARFPAGSAAGSVLRLPLRLLPARAVVRIASGPNRGLRWRVGASIPACWMGTYEPELAAAVAPFLRAGLVVWDIGANAGYHTLHFSRRVGPRGRVIAVEPLPSNAANLLDHVRWNGLHNVTVVPAAVAAGPGTAPFTLAAHNAEGALSRRPSPLRVPHFALDFLVASGLPAPALVKVDVEGAEADVLRGAVGVLAARRAVWLVAVHGEGPKRDCVRMLARHGYLVLDVSGSPVHAGSYELLGKPASRGRSRRR
ncbi:MAG: FkbM family methyltransferase [Candidatus Coatesbacteria bacterium]